VLLHQRGRAQLADRGTRDALTVHGTFTVVRSFEAPPSAVFRAFSDLSLRRRWFRIPGRSGTHRHELDFRIGGGECCRGTFAPAGVEEHIEYRSRFLDIAADERIVLTSELVLDGRRRSVSLVTIELAPGDGGTTAMTYTEQYAFLAPEGDGRAEVAEREGGTRLQLNGLKAVLERAAA
jgi:uncharacterized protein YndB with AHSA1/START domain